MGRVDGRQRGEVIVGVVDDSAADLAWVKRMLDHLAQWDIQVLEFMDPAEAIESLTAQTVDLILTDYHMGKWTGLDVLEQLRTVGQDAPAVILTGGDLSSLPTAPIEAGVAGYLSKDGLSSQQLSECFERILSASAD